MKDASAQGSIMFASIQQYFSPFTARSLGLAAAQAVLIFIAAGFALA